MKKQKKQSLLTAIIFILVIALVMLVGSIIYEEKINISKQPTQNTSTPVIDAESDEHEEEEQLQDNITENDNENKDEEQEDEENIEEPKEENNEYVGKEENNTEDTSKSKDDKAILLAKQEWGEDNGVTFSVEEKKNSTYYVAVRSGGVVLAWYEVNTETWEISEYY